MKSHKQHEPRWPPLMATLAIVGLLSALPQRLIAGPVWLLPLIALSLLAVGLFSHRAGKVEMNFRTGVILLAVITTAEISSLVFLVTNLLQKRMPPLELLRAAAVLWIGNILIFASWYWRLDAGGPHRRDLRDTHSEGAFVFPQLTLPHPSEKRPPRWKPGFIDYLFLAFNTSTAFSPTDTPVLSSWAKFLMMVQSSISLTTIVVLAARAVGVL